MAKQANVTEQTASAPEQTASAPQATASAPEQTASAPQATASAPEITLTLAKAPEQRGAADGQRDTKALSIYPCVVNAGYTLHADGQQIASGARGFVRERYKNDADLLVVEFKQLDGIWNVPTAAIARVLTEREKQESARNVVREIASYAPYNTASETLEKQIDAHAAVPLLESGFNTYTRANLVYTLACLDLAVAADTPSETRDKAYAEICNANSKLMHVARAVRNAGSKIV